MRPRAQSERKDKHRTARIGSPKHRLERREFQTAFQYDARKTQRPWRTHHRIARVTKAFADYLTGPRKTQTISGDIFYSSISVPVNQPPWRHFGADSENETRI